MAKRCLRGPSLGFKSARGAALPKILYTSANDVYIVTQRHRVAGSPPSGKLAKANHRTAHQDRRKIRKKIGNLERKIAHIDDKKRQLNKEMLETTDAEEALRLHNEVADITKELGEAEESWLELQKEFDESEFTA